MANTMMMDRTGMGMPGMGMPGMTAPTVGAPTGMPVGPNYLLHYDAKKKKAIECQFSAARSIIGPPPERLLLQPEQRRW